MVLNYHTSFVWGHLYRMVSSLLSPPPPPQKKTPNTIIYVFSTTNVIFEVWDKCFFSVIIFLSSSLHNNNSHLYPLFSSSIRELLNVANSAKLQVTTKLFDSSTYLPTCCHYGPKYISDVTLHTSFPREVP